MKNDKPLSKIDSSLNPYKIKPATFEVSKDASKEPGFIDNSIPDDNQGHI